MSRTSSRSETFAHPFQLAGMTLAHAPGTFEVWLEEVELDVSWQAYVGVTTIMLGTAGHKEAWVIKPDELEAALAADAAKTRAPASQATTTGARPARIG
jgi:hypothetical protein